MAVIPIFGALPLPAIISCAVGLPTRGSVGARLSHSGSVPYSTYAVGQVRGISVATRAGGCGPAGIRGPSGGGRV